MLPWAVIGPQELMIVGIGVIVLFGAKKLPELARGLGEGMKEFKKAVKDINTDEPAANPVVTPAASTPTSATATTTTTPAPESAEDVEKRIVH
jgi:sec-independent protein translocase protein TatA